MEMPNFSPLLSIVNMKRDKFSHMQRRLLFIYLMIHNFVTLNASTHDQPYAKIPCPLFSRRDENCPHHFSVYNFGEMNTARR